MKVRRWQNCPVTQRARYPRQAAHSHITAKEKTTDVKGRRGAGAHLEQSTGGPQPGHVACSSQGKTETHRTNNHAHTH
ncbi:hypothetical protein AMECASPLE_012896 [Ameca splendens]|uniref:Uncharacterized protein n=1 Tax=Ameca splendens TaxID=208324 RepID=A0ABV0ZBB6_9TELE